MDKPSMKYNIEGLFCCPFFFFKILFCFCEPIALEWTLSGKLTVGFLYKIFK